jgi:uncharacterized membrane protein YccF (DUF307 family)
LTAPNSVDSKDVGPDVAVAGDDQRAYDFAYGHGRMPAFMKVVWLGFLAFGAWYVVAHLLTALADEMK